MNSERESMMKTICLLIAVLSLLVIGCEMGGNSIPAPAEKIRDMAWDGEHLWSAHSESNMIYKFNSKGDVLSSFKTPEIGPRGLAWDGVNLWVSTIGGSKILKMSVEGEVLDSFDAPGLTPSGLAWVEGSLYYIDAGTMGKLYEFDPNTGEVAQTFDMPLTRHEGLAWDGEHLIMVTSISNEIFWIDLDSGEVTRQVRMKRNNPVGLAWDGKRIWVSYPGDHLIEVATPE
jgi:sugar lactone lactonase YvrE